jgi:hypothetical protein
MGISGQPLVAEKSTSEDHGEMLNPSIRQLEKREDDSHHHGWVDWTYLCWKSIMLRRRQQLLWITTAGKLDQLNVLKNNSFWTTRSTAFRYRGWKSFDCTRAQLTELGWVWACALVKFAALSLYCGKAYVVMLQSGAEVRTLPTRQNGGKPARRWVPGDKTAKWAFRDRVDDMN